MRSKELDNTAVPLPFKIYATIQTVKYHEVERHVHKVIDRLTDLRIRQNREFFNVAPEVALEILREIAKLIDDAVVSVYKDNKPVADLQIGQAIPASIKSKPPRAKHFRFSMIDIKVGETLTFDPTGIEVTVASDNTIEYEGRIYKLSPFVGTFMPPDQQVPSGHYQGPLYFSYKGKTLTELRRMAETKTDDVVVSVDQVNESVADLQAEQDITTEPAPKTARAKPFRFSMIGIKVGENLTFDPTGIEVTVASDNTIEYEGRNYKLSPFAAAFMPEDRKHSGAYAGPHYFSYKGKGLNVLRREAESQLEPDTE